MNHACHKHLSNCETKTLFPDSHIGEWYIARIKGDWNSRQKEAQDKLITMLLSEEFTQIIAKYGIKR